MITLLVAFDENRVIGNQGKIPWNIPEDFNLFREKTLGHSVIMGRKTWESLPKRPLPNRVNMILSSRFCLCPEEFVQTLNAPETNSPSHCVEKLENAIQFLESICPEKQIFIIGGEQIYRAALENGFVDKIIVSKIHGIHEGDAFFPEIEDWDCEKVTKHDQFDVMEMKKCY